MCKSPYITSLSFHLCVSGSFISLQRVGPISLHSQGGDLESPMSFQNALLCGELVT
jgi:hypothetical protein